MNNDQRTMNKPTFNTIPCRITLTGAASAKPITLRTTVKRLMPFITVFKSYKAPQLRA